MCYNAAMRAILNISLPQEMADSLREEVKTSGKYATVSELVRELLRKWREEKVAAKIRHSEEQFNKGEFKVLRSLKDLR